MRVLGVDPGTYHLGVGVVDYDDGDFRHMYSAVVSPAKSGALPHRLAYLYEHLCDIIRQWVPDEVAIEQPFASRNVKAAMAIGQAQAIAMLVAAQSQVPVTTYPPRRIKQAVTDYGGSSKEQVQEMVAALLGGEEVFESSDEADALAVAICHINSNRSADIVFLD
jgi:crossover junction endodeoxyribonuclease RuvC